MKFVPGDRSEGGAKTFVIPDEPITPKDLRGMDRKEVERFACACHAVVMYMAECGTFDEMSEDELGEMSERVVNAALG